MFSNRKIILVILLLITASIAGYVIIVVIPARLAQQTYDGAKQIGKDIGDALQFTPEISIQNTIVVQQQASILELATLSQKFQHKYEWKNQWLGSEKTITITGTIDAKVGFDLRKKFNIVIDETSARVILPDPQILSIESLGDLKFEDENGYWNWVNAQDRSLAVNAFMVNARRYAEQAPFVKDANKSVEEKITTILKSHGKTVVIQYESELTKPLFSE
ncbi:MAG TPA: DUF4230 domain-containing protein [Chryseolinea sp.]|nr:DUF4230 domain-containing protein [Chryseolinea sp.]HPM29851.1 DUF4230 domain-containing protein [Chryseolinea sp.]